MAAQPHRSITRRLGIGRIGALVGALVGAIVVGTTAEGQLPAPTRPAPARPDTAFVDVTAVHENVQNEDPSAHFVGKLPNPLTYYEEHGDELYRMLAKKPWHGHDRVRECSDCDPGQTATMRIEAISNLHLDPLTGLPRNGVVVGRVINTGATRDRRTTIRPGPIGHPDHLYYVITDVGSRTYAALWTATIHFDTAGTPMRHVDIQRAPVNFKKCPAHAEPRRRWSEGDFKDCPSLKGSVGHSALMFVSNHPALAHQAALDMLAWFSCDAGCCTAQWPPSS